MIAEHVEQGPGKTVFTTLEMTYAYGQVKLSEATSRQCNFQIIPEIQHSSDWRKHFGRDVRARPITTINYRHFKKIQSTESEQTCESLATKLQRVTAGSERFYLHR